MPLRYADPDAARILAVRILRLECCLLAASGTATQRTGSSLTPAVVVAGSPELISVHLLQMRRPSASRPKGNMARPKARVFSRARRAHLVCAGRSRRTGIRGFLYTSDKCQAGQRNSIDLSRNVEILPAHYRTETIEVAPKFVEPGSDEMTRIKAEVELKSESFRVERGRATVVRRFSAPVHAPPTDSFGTRRTFNGKLASIHKGMDFRAATGTPVHAGNSGVVVLAQPLYYEGNCVVIDHGLGLFTISMHLSRIDVHEGDHVRSRPAARAERRHGPCNRATSALGGALAERLSRSSKDAEDESEQRALARNRLLFGSGR